ncbi:Na+/Pi-cotransporter [Caprobacter fermentans]|uniref:Na+/Pi-cotransporter n=1 Tax=Caproicibacter fermentans TaxID=2576756 RepID=A0A6N8HY19_9FIRM|nr:Na/Pi cotransporter family protein [Caproicibacter fermentans]MVB10568.1 Na+/Pi-cotransporter [Caproicibacter fermentans]QNK41598.1 Na/Pi cotransporter family protein [Caproicibacter fermentans]
MTLDNILMLLGGLGLFLYGMKLMGESLELAAGSRIKEMAERLTTNKYMGALLGFAVTAVIQSSSATTVMVVGFVNAGIMDLTQAVGIIMGANVGTTVTGLITAINFMAIAPVAVFVGVGMIMFSKKSNSKHIGQIIAGFGILFLGMSTMSSAMKPLGQSTLFSDIITNFQNPLIGLLAGMLFTAVIQSSSATVGVLQSLALSGVIDLKSVIFVIFGLNIGTCVTAMLSSIGTNRTARRTAIVHLLFNVIGAALFTVITIITPFARLVMFLSPENVLFQIFLVHIIFNVVTTALLLPMSGVLIRLAYKIIPGEDARSQAMSLKYLDSRILSTPPVAVSQLLKEVGRMASLAKTNFLNSMAALFDKDPVKIKELEENESVINFLNQRITSFLIRINALDLEDNDRQIVGALFHVINDIERIGDHSENIGEQAQIVIDGKASLSSVASDELHEMQNLIVSILDDSFQLFLLGSNDAELSFTVNNTEETIDNRTEELKENHICRLNNGQCNAESSALFNDLLINLERIADHATNIAFSMSHTKRVPILSEGK